MKKAFDQNVSRAKPRLRLGSFGGPTETFAESPESFDAAPPPPPPEPATSAAPPQHELLAQEIQARASKARQPRASAALMFHEALKEAAFQDGEQVVTRQETTVETVVPMQEARSVAPVQTAVPPPVPRSAPPVEAVTPPAPVARAAEPTGPTPEVRRERLKERLKAVRENPRPQPLPSTSAEAGVLAVERIAGLQVELTQVRALNLALTQDLEAARRQSERATEEARLRIDEAQRLAGEMQGRVKLLNDLERELSSLEGERDEALLSLQESRAMLEAAGQEATGLRDEIEARERSLQESLSEEERLAGELEHSQQEREGLRRALDTLQRERETLTRQVTDLTTERAELLEARKALEAVHRALSQATVR